MRSNVTLQFRLDYESLDRSVIFFFPILLLGFSNYCNVSSIDRGAIAYKSKTNFVLSEKNILSRSSDKSKQLIAP